MEELINYIKEWTSIEGVKPKNDKIFIDGFIEFLKTIDDSRDFVFDGEGAYFGYQISVCEDSSYFGDPYLNFELAYNKQMISIYKGNHDGFWTPEYVKIDSTNERFSELYLSIRDKAISILGFNELLTNKD